MNEISNKQPNQPTKPIIITCFLWLTWWQMIWIFRVFFSRFQMSNVKWWYSNLNVSMVVMVDSIIILPSIMIDCRIKGFFPYFWYTGNLFKLEFFHSSFKKRIPKIIRIFFQQQQRKKSRKSISKDDSWS